MSTPLTPASSLFGLPGLALSARGPSEDPRRDHPSGIFLPFPTQHPPQPLVGEVGDTGEDVGGSGDHPRTRLRLLGNSHPPFLPGRLPTPVLLREGGG